MSTSGLPIAPSATSAAFRLAVAGLTVDDRRKPFELCERLLRHGVGEHDCAPLKDLLFGLSDEEARYWISCLYAVLMPQQRRKRLAAYFTPPHLTSYVLELLSSNGVDFFGDSIHDPACGGAAFLAPLADRLRRAAVAEGWPPEKILGRVQKGLSGVELEPRLAQLAQIVVEETLREETTAAGRSLASVVTTGNSLTIAEGKTYDVIVANPPYGRVRSASTRLTERWQTVLSESHVNTYALFTALALERAKPGGLIALIIPTSFVGGPYFAKLRQLVLRNAEVLSLDLVDRRSDIFVDVTQDTCVLLLKRHRSEVKSKSRPTCALIASDGSAKYLGRVDVPDDAGSRFWVLPSEAVNNNDLPFFDPGFTTLEDWGYRVRSGHFVWNRNQEKIVTGARRGPTDLPLLWATDVKRGEEIDLAAHARECDHVTIPATEASAVKGDAILLQRTTNRNQHSRLNACVVRTGRQATPGFVSENHTIVVEPITQGAEKVSVEIMMLLLNSKPIDERFRRISGTVSVSVRALRALPLPRPHLFIEALNEMLSPDAAAHAALSRSISRAAASHGTDIRTDCAVADTL